MPKVELNLPNPKNWLIFSAGVGIMGVLVILLLIWGREANKPRTLLPESIASSTKFEPYFFNGSIPVGYTFKREDVVYSGGILSIRLTKAGAKDITISQQRMPDKLRQSQLLSKGDKLDIPIGFANINSIDGHILGTVITSDKEQTLILISSSEFGERNSVISFAKALQKAR